MLLLLFRNSIIYRNSYYNQSCCYININIIELFRHTASHLEGSCRFLDIDREGFTLFSSHGFTLLEYIHIQYTRSVWVHIVTWSPQKIFLDMVKIIDKINQNDSTNPYFSFEYFPPKTDAGVENL